MGLYGSWIFPRLLAMVMRQPVLDDYRRRAVTAARGRVLELGVGAGANLPLYGEAVEHVAAIDVSDELLAMARRQPARVPVTLLNASAEALPFAAASMDTVVITWTLCSIPDPARALAEVRRVLRPEGRLFFVEHGLAPEPAVRGWQRRLTPAWRVVGGGCHLDRPMDTLIRQAGFDIVELEAGYMKGPKVLAYMYQGWAR